MSGGRFSFSFADMKNFEEKSASCALNRIFGFEPKTGTSLIAHIGSAAEVFRLSGKDKDRLLGPYSKHKGQITPHSLENASKELLALESKGISFVGITEDDYPELLKDCADAPVGLYVRSSTPASELFAPRRRIAVIGTRDISPYGREWCGRIVQGLVSSPEKPVVVSGLALGTDICAHVTALDYGLATIGVMATGPEAVYPLRHQSFADRIASSEGSALITDYPPGTAPLAIHFLRRNRIIAGISEAVILVESKAKGGGMMTARLASSYGREVYALPGRADDIRSQGCNILIRDKLAEPLTSVADMLDGLGIGYQKVNCKESDSQRLYKVYRGAVKDEKIALMARIMDAIRKDRGICLDDLSAAAGLDYATLSELVGMLEMDGFISIDLLQRCTICMRR